MVEGRNRAPRRSVICGVLGGEVVRRGIAFPQAASAYARLVAQNHVWTLCSAPSLTRTLHYVTSPPTIGVLALQGDVREHQTALGRVGVAAPAVRRPAELAAVDGLVIPGGESTTMAKLLHVFELWQPLAAALRDGLPAYGSCAGMIVLATRVLDGRPDQPCLGAIDVAVRRNAFGRQTESFEAAVAMPALGAEPVTGVFIRAPWIESCGTGVDVLATVPTNDGPHPVAARQGNVLVTSFHPEVTPDDRVHRYFADMVGACG